MVWLDPEKTSPYAFYQFWINTDDQSAEKYIKIYTFLELEEIESMIEEHRKAPEKRLLQKTLAFEVTKLIHGEETTKRVIEASDVLFSKEALNLSDEIINILASEMPTSEISRSELSALTTVDIIAQSGLTKSKTETRQLIDGKWITINNQAAADFDWNSVKSHAALLRKWKKDYRLLIIK